MERSRTELRAYAMLGLVMLLWAGNSIVARAVRHDIPPFTLAFVRWAAALLILLPFASRKVIADWPMIRAGWKPIALLGLSGVGAFNVLLYAGLQYTTATNALLIQAAIPALVLLLDLLMFRARAPRWQVMGVLVSTIGVGLIVFRADLAALLSLRFGYGDVLILGGVIAWSFYTVWLRLRPAIDPLSFIAVTFAIGVVVTAPLAATEWRAIAAIHWQPAVFGAFAYVAVLPSIIAYNLFNRSVAMVGPARAGQAIALMPLFGALLAALLLDEKLHGYHLVGMALILGGILISAFARRAPIS